MRTAAVLYFILGSVFATPGSLAGQSQATGPDPGSTDTYFTIHNLYPAHEITQGAGTKVGIIDRSFGMEAHPELYAGGRNFLVKASASDAEPETYHGYWMALTLREIAPKAEIFALGAHTQDETARVDAIVQALDWAVQHELDVVTYCAGGFSEAARKALDPAVDRAIGAGVVVVFVDYPHPLNLLPGGMGTTDENRARNPDLNIFSHDCTVFIADQMVALADPDDDGIQKNRPFLGRPSTGPVTAGFVALVRSMDPEAPPGEIKRILRTTSRPLSYRGQLAARVPDLFQAVTHTVGAYPEAQQGKMRD